MEKEDILQRQPDGILKSVPASHKTSYDIKDFQNVKDIGITYREGKPIICGYVLMGIIKGDPQHKGEGPIQIEWDNIESQEDIAVFNEKDEPLDVWFKEFDLDKKEAVLYVYNHWVRDDSVQAKIAYGRDYK